VRTVATSRGIGFDRAGLQILGQALIEEFGPDAFVKEVLTSGQGSGSAITILDGVRSVEIWHAVQALASSCILVYLDIEEEERIRRLVERDGLDTISIQLAMKHPMETSVLELRPHADLVLRKNSIDKMVSEIMLLPKLKRIR
jgi:dephospho-CoA kinase